ncbi:hypothetical protein JM946_02000 [Steroidobacter sp. S1-65]|uniref:Polymer-forming cytoskeletal protein n=1 Tax=Steroidobacter gossypii TaxID=2805490 RepID=A0ABS1WR91_9GAMM|nr:hypothetical protein [Steroidobacter gossypii]MBM0103492.1 hypothetical protein [Steroidobacter gossypii]
MRNKLAALSTVVLVLASPLLWADGENISKVNGSIHVASGRQVGSVETVNGSIRLESSVTAGDIETVSGSIDIGSDSSVGDIDGVNGDVTLERGVKAESVELVNGELRIDEQAQVRGDVTSVNGDIVLARQAQVGGHVENVNGAIELDAARVGNGIKTTNGDIEIGAGSRVDGGIHVEKPDFSMFSSKKHKPKVTIGPDAVVNGTLRFDRPVELRISERATVGKIVGATPIKD